MEKAYNRQTEILNRAQNVVAATSHGAGPYTLQTRVDARNSAEEAMGYLGRRQFHLALVHVKYAESILTNARETGYEDVTDARLPEGWTLHVWPDGRAMVCSDRTSPAELGGYAATLASVDDAVEHVADLIEDL